MTDKISWKQVLEKSHKIFFHNRPKDDLAAKIAATLFLEEALSRKIDAPTAFKILSNDELIAGFVSDADELIKKNRLHDIEQTQKLANLEQSATRMEAALSQLDATATRLETTSTAIDTRTTSIATTIETAVMKKLQEAVDNAFEAAKNTALKSAIKAAVVTTIILGIPTNLGTSFYYDRRLSVDAEKRLEEQQAKKIRCKCATSKAVRYSAPYCIAFIRITKCTTTFC